MVRNLTIKTIYYILDGINKYDKASLEMLLKKFTALLSIKTNKSLVYYLNLLIVNRAFLDFILELLSSFSYITLDPDIDTKIN